MPVVRVSSETEASDFIKKHSVYAVGFFENFEVCTLNSCVMLHDFAIF